jgi:hypothetical protein
MTRRDVAMILVGSAEGYTWSKHWVPECVHSQA